MELIRQIDTPTPPMTPAQRALIVHEATFVSPRLAGQIEADGVELARLTGMLDDYYPAVDWWILQAKEAHEAQLKAEAALTAELAAAQAEISRLTKINVKLCADFNLMNQHGAKQDAEIARLTAALATPDQIAALAADRAATVTVKPLVWIKHPSADIWRCDTMIGTYKVFGGMPSWDFDSATDAKDKTSHTSTSAKLAKAASQADYDARIRSAITITSGASPDTIAKSDDFVSLPRAEVETLMEAVDAIDDEYCGQQYGPSLHTIDKMRMALLALQERMK